MDYKAFRQLLKRYLDNTCTDEERRVVDQWYELLENEAEIPGDRDLANIEDRIWNKIQANTSFETPVRTLPEKSRRTWLGAASVLAALLALTFFLTYNKKENNPQKAVASTYIPKELLKEVKNSSASIQTITLEDGSSVQIYPGSKLSYPGAFAADKREVYLEGDAFFTVSKNPARPFYVYSNQIVTQVLGTSFEVSGKNGRIEVNVKTGKVAVYENNSVVNLDASQQKSNGVIITPNQKVTYYQEERHFVTAIVDQPLPVVKEQDQQIPDSHFNYNETPLTKVLKDIESTYELEIILENEKIRNCLFTGNLAGENLFNKLEGICLVFGISYELKGTKILLKGGKECTS
jgi:transmembrane sensor